MKGVKDAIGRLADNFDHFAQDLRGIVDDLPDGAAGAGEEPEREAEVAQAPARDGINDDTQITMRSGDLREVVDAYRKLVRFAREGRIPTQDQRQKGHLAVRKIKHLFRKPIR